jgi:hypothetical protein
MIEIKVGNGSRVVKLSIDAWDRLRGSAPYPCTSEDQTDFAHGMIEAWARAARKLSNDELEEELDREGWSARGFVLASELDVRRLS